MSIPRVPEVKEISQGKYENDFSTILLAESTHVRWKCQDGSWDDGWILVDDVNQYCWDSHQAGAPVSRVLVMRRFSRTPLFILFERLERVPMRSEYENAPRTGG